MGHYDDCHPEDFIWPDNHVCSPNYKKPPEYKNLAEELERIMTNKVEDSSLDIQEGGEHYKRKGIQPIEFITSNELTFAEGNVVKYIFRHKEKGGAEDVKKALHYCKLILELEYDIKDE